MPRDRLPVVSLDFSVTYSFRLYYDPGVDSVPSENDYQEYFLSVKTAGEADNLTIFTCRMSWKSGSLNLLEPSGPHQACHGTPLPFTSPLYSCVSVQRISLVICLPVSPVPIKVVSFRSSPKGWTILTSPRYKTDRLIRFHSVSARDIDGKCFNSF